MEKKTALRLVKDELARASKGHAAMNSAHEGYAVLREEVDELWEEIKANRGTSHRGVSEAVQVAAMALRYLIDLCDEPTAGQHEEKVRAYEAFPNPGWAGGGFGGYSG